MSFSQQIAKPKLSNKIVINLFQNNFNTGRYEGKVHKVEIFEKTATITLSSISRTGKQENANYELHAWYSADNGGSIWNHNFIATSRMTTQTLTADLQLFSSWQKWNESFFNFDLLGVTLAGGEIFIDRNLSR